MGVANATGGKMRLIALLAARNEAWCLPTTLRGMLAWADAVAVLLHACTDGTESLIATLDAAHEFPGRVHVRCEANPAWNEIDYRRQLHEWGRSLDGTHFAVMDADELLTTTAAGEMRGRCAALKPGEGFTLPWLNCWRSPDCYRSDNSPFGTGVMPVAFADSPGNDLQLPPDGYQLHCRVQGVLLSMLGDRRGGDGILHFQHVVWARVQAKQALYQMDEVLRWPGRRSPAEVAAYYSQACDEAGLETLPVPPEWWPVENTLDLDAPPWQAVEVRRLLGIHGREKFAGLNLFGLDTP